MQLIPLAPTRKWRSMSSELRLPPQLGSARTSLHARNDYKRLAPASTGLLVASIILAHRLWVLDVTSMSLYWVARLPIKRPREQASRISPGILRLRKIALSLAIVGALAAPFAFRTYKLQPTYAVWVPLTAQEKGKLATSLQNSNYCRTQAGNVVIDFVCDHEKEKFELGGDYEYHADWPKYVAVNVGAAAATFVGVFSLAFLVPILIHGLAFLARRYWKWLNA